MNEKMTEYRQQRLELASQYASSGLTAKEFCKQHNFPEHQFYYWIKIIKGKKKFATSKVVNSFVPVKVVKHKSVSATDPIVELVCPNGIRLKFYSPINFSELRSLIK